MTDDVLDALRTTQHLREEVAARTGSIESQVSGFREALRSIDRRLGSSDDRDQKSLEALRDDIASLRQRIGHLENIASGVNDKMANAMRDPLDRIEARLEEQIGAKASKSEVKQIRDDIRRGVWIVMTTVIGGAVTAAMLAATGKLPGLG